MNKVLALSPSALPTESSKGDTEGSMVIRMVTEAHATCCGDKRRKPLTSPGVCVSGKASWSRWHLARPWHTSRCLTMERRREGRTFLTQRIGGGWLGLVSYLCECEWQITGRKRQYERNNCYEDRSCDSISLFTYLNCCCHRSWQNN